MNHFYQSGKFTKPVTGQWLLLLIIILLQGCVLFPEPVEVESDLPSINPPTPGTLVYVCGNEIFLSDANGTTPKQLTSDRRVKTSPILSKDLQRIAYLVQTPYSSSSYHPVIIEANGRHIVNLTGDNINKISWTADGYTLCMARVVSSIYSASLSFKFQGKVLTQAVIPLTHRYDEITAFAMGPNDIMVYAIDLWNNNNKVYFYDPRSNKVIRTYTVPNGEIVRSISWSSEKNAIMMTLDDRSNTYAVYWNLDKAAPDATLLPAGPQVVLNKDGLYYATSGSPLRFVNMQQRRFYTPAIAPIGCSSGTAINQFDWK